MSGGPRFRDVYRGAASLLRAGLLPAQAIESLRGHGQLPEPLAARLSQSIAAGVPLSAALAEHASIPAEEVALIAAGEATGRLDSVLDRLAEVRERRERLRRELLRRASYPALLFHVAALLMPVAMLGLHAQLTFPAWLGRVLLVLAPAYAIAAAVFLLSRQPRWRARFARLVEALPGFGRAARHRRRSDFALVLAAAYDSGMPVDAAVGLAARASRTPAAEAAAARTADGRPLTAALADTGAVAPHALGRLATAEHAGELSPALAAIAEEEAAAAEHAAELAVAAVGKLLYFAMLLWIAAFVLGFYAELWGAYGLGAK